MTVISALCVALAASGAGVKYYTVKVLQTYRHDRSAYTQGLFFNGGRLYESTGQYGESSLRIVDLASGAILRHKDLDRKYFGEGSCIVGDRLYMLTWTNKVAFIADPSTLEIVRTVSYPREGWGLTAIPATRKDAPAALPAGAGAAVMVASDGSANLFYLDRDLRTLASVRVTLNGRPLRYLNELEWIDGRIWANVYTTDMIAVINPVTGVVEACIDCSKLIPRERRTPDMDVLNGIATDAAGNIYLTGKNWPSLFKVELVNQ